MCSSCGAQKLVASARLLVVDSNGRTAHEYALLKFPNTIGSDPTNDIVISDPAVSRRHAIIQRTRDAYEVSDLNSTNGTYVNSRRIAGSVVLSNGASISFGT